MLRKIVIFVLLAAVTSLVTATEDIIVKGEIRLDENITTATGFQSTVKEQVKNVTVISKEDIEKKGYKNLQEVLKDAPGISFVDVGFGGSIDIRGQGTEGVSKVKVMVDGVTMNLLDTSHGATPINSIGISNIERIEIIPGGGAVLYGNGTVGGVVNIITKAPEETGGSAAIEYGSHYDKNASIYTGFKVTDQLFLNFDFSGRDARTYRDKEKFKNNYWAGGLTYKITSNQSLTLKASRFTEDRTASSSITKKQMEEDRQQAGSSLTDYEEKRTEFTLNYGINVLENLRLEATGYLQDKKTTLKMNNKGVMTYTTDGLFEDKKKGINFKGKYDYSKGEVIFGYNFLENDMLRGSHSYFPNGKTMSRAVVDLSKTTNSLYILEKHNILENLQLIGGFREEWASYKINRTDGKFIIDSDKNENNSAWELGLNYLYRDTGNVYIRYEHGFLSPAPAQLTNKSPLRGYYLNDLKSETYNTFEIGMKDVVMGSYVSATMYYTNTDDEISQVFSAERGGGWEFYNLDKTRRYGMELFSEQYFGKLVISESLSYINAKITAGPEKGEKIPYVPEVKATLGLSYEIIKNLNTGINLNYFSSTEDSRGVKIDTYSTTDLVVKYGFDNGIHLIAGVNNLFNKKYNEYQNTNRAGITNYIPADEINYYIGLKYEF
ncbi:TonB-dependent receptor [Sebaldella sp. S0638]|uniref:TonB-dependent receptor n=1 Tax=Sebaldella sp. S0638 TaxID=2957809 RepID=UPI0020A1EECD|nr:TonB-dependent receptor [Sebaldella sp. S0638]MCP1225669.1 TonB-dependent receptor [Sebaldella sp. S0638]